MNKLRESVGFLALGSFLALAWGLAGCGLSQLSPATDQAAEAQLKPVEASPAPGLGVSAPATPAPASGVDPATRSGPGRPRWVRVRSGDTLWGLAARPDIYGSGWYYPLLIHANARLLPDPAHPRLGLRLRVPRDVPKVRAELAEEEAMTGQLLGRKGSRLRARVRRTLLSLSGPEPALPLPAAASPTAVSAPAAPPTPVPAPTAPPLQTPLPAPTPRPSAPAPAASTSFGLAGWSLVLLVAAVFAVLIWILRRGRGEGS